MGENQTKPLGVEGKAPDGEEPLFSPDEIQAMRAWVEEARREREGGGATPNKPHRKELSVWTHRAIQLYLKLARTERRAEEIRAELDSVMVNVPIEDLEEYTKITDKIQTREDEKLEKYLSRLLR